MGATQTNMGQEHQSARAVPDAAVLLAAGLGQRLRPLTATRPKPLIEVGGQSLLSRVVDLAAQEGVRHFAVNTHHLAEQVEMAVNELGARHPEFRFALSPEVEGLLDTGGGARRASEALQGPAAFVFNTDSFWLLGTDRPLARMVQRATKADDVVLLCAHPARSLGFRRSHDFCLDPLGDVTLDRGLPVIFAGVCLLPRRLLASAPDGPFSMSALFEQALARSALKGVLLNTQWLHVGDPEALDEANRFLGANPCPPKV